MNDDEKTVPVAGGYNAANIQVLEGMEAVRKRPAMYIGDTGERGYHHLVYEVVDNSIDEALAGYCTQIDVIINPDGSLTVADNGRGIPVDMHPTQHRPAIEVVLTVLHAGGKFDGSNYKVSGGLHGVGVSCVNALSDWMKVEVKRGGKIHHIEFSRGHVTKPLTIVGECGGETGTRVTFFPDHTIFSCHAFKWEILCNRLRELAFLNKGVTIHFRDDEGEAHHEETFH
ncbi:MAG TPA: DNA topoisomerase IV subunit B, partial [Verrucomicrobia bacterium]|nr:DNA topoisomerase IV subunit B [Verrucomicrobiota bacterium]